MTMLNTGETFLIESLWYIPMGDHVPVYNRPYVVNSDQGAVDIITDRMFETGATNITPTILSDLSARLIQPNIAGEVSIIDNNWVSTKRFVFVLKVRTTDAFGTEGYSYVQGYTDYDGVSQQGNADGRMMHYINNIIETNVFSYQTPAGMNRVEKLSKIYNILGSHNHEYFTQRPRDIIENLDLIEMTNNMSMGDIKVEGIHTGNYINQFNQNVVSSAISNNVSSEYLCKILNGGIAKHRARNIFTDSFDMTTDSSMGEQVVEPSINDNRFVKYLNVMGGFNITKESFSFSQLQMIDHTVHDRFTLFNITKSYVNPMMLNTPTVGDFWHGQDPVTLHAYSLIESSVSMATRHGFNKLSFTVTNMSDPTGRIDIFVTNFNSYINLDDRDIAHLLELFKNKFTMDVFVSESQGGTIPIFMEMYVDLLGTSKIKLSWGGFPENWYTVPTAANSLFSPVLTVDQSSLDAVSVQFGSLVAEIAGHDGKFKNNF